jgi:hypothetical protein
VHQGTNGPCRSLVFAALLGLVATPVFGEPPGLAVLMERLQTYTHKLQLSIAARNQPLANFYLHELEETSEYVADNIERYDQYPVGQLTREMLLPMIEQLEEVVATGPWEMSELRLKDVVFACNACHVATGFGFIRVAPARSNPFAQDFAVADED